MSRSPPRATVALHCGSRSTSSVCEPAAADAGGDVDRGRRLPDSALLVRDRVDDTHRPETRRFPAAASSPCPARRGRSVGVGAALAQHVEVAVAAAGVGPDGEDPLAAPSPGQSAARSSSSSSSSSRRALPGDQGAALAEQRRGELGEGREAADGAGGDRVEGLACRRRAASSSERALRTSALAIPAAAIARRMNSHLRPTDSTSSTRAAGSATARTRPGNPAPEPISAIREAAASGSTSSPVRLSSTWTFQACAGSVTELTEARSSASSSSTISSARRAPGSRFGGCGRRSLRDERRDDDAAVGLVAFAVGLDPGALFEVLVDDAALLGAHLVHLDRAVARRAPARRRGRRGRSRTSRRRSR